MGCNYSSMLKHNNILTLISYLSADIHIWLFPCTISILLHHWHWCYDIICPSASEVTLKDMCTIGWYLALTTLNKEQIIHILFSMFCTIQHRADSGYAPSQWEISLQSNSVSHWLGANLESALQNCKQNGPQLDSFRVSYITEFQEGKYIILAVIFSKLGHDEVMDNITVRQ